MGMPASHTEWTVEMVHDLPDDGNRYEVIDGALLVSPAPSYLHQRALLRLYQILQPYVEEIGQDVVVAPAAVTFSKRREVQPDLFVLPKRDGRRATRFEDVGVLTLAVEVASPHTARTDRREKQRLYQSERVPEYWMVNPNARTVERWRSGIDRREVLATTLMWQPILTHDALTIDLTQYFRAAHDDP